MGYTATATYRPAGLATEGYPGGRTLTYGVDPLGRVTSVSGLKSLTPASYVTAISYAAHGGQSSVAFGNLQTETRTWDHRIQPATMARGSSFALTYAYCPGGAASCATNNGNPVSQTIGQAGNAQQTYTYDAVGWLASAAEGAGGSTWSRVYGHDQPGNTWVSSHSGGSLDPFTPVADLTFNTIDNNNNNQLTIQGSEYDAVGHQKKIGGYTQTYDGEGRLVTSELNSITTAMSYDGEGQRVQKITCRAGTKPCTASVSGATVTTYVYDAAGNLAAEYSGSPSAQTGCGTPTCYVSVDQVGCTRLVTDADGKVVRRYDYLPFGQELWAGTGGRTTAMGYQSEPDGFNPKFTGQQRDTENFLDYFHARYYSPQQGRFVSVDPENAGADLMNPQTWNGYAYVGNNPLNITDPSGESWFSTLAGVLAGLVTLNPGVGLEVAGIFSSFENVMNGEPPTLDLFGAVGGANASDLFKCGGPLGTCGTLESGPWSERTGLDHVENSDLFVFTFQDQSLTGSWSTDYKGGLFWYKFSGRPKNASLQMKAAPKRTKLSVAGGCAIYSIKDHWLGIEAATLGGPIPKRWLGDKVVGTPWSSLLSDVGSRHSIRMASPMYGPGSMTTTNLFRGLGRVLAPASFVINIGELIKTAGDASTCYGISQ